MTPESMRWISPSGTGRPAMQSIVYRHGKKARWSWFLPYSTTTMHIAFPPLKAMVLKVSIFFQVMHCFHILPTKRASSPLDSSTVEVLRVLPLHQNSLFLPHYRVHTCKILAASAWPSGATLAPPWCFLQKPKHWRFCLNLKHAQTKGINCPSLSFPFPTLT